MSDFSKVGKSSIVLKHIFEMADELGMLTLVEGVESLK
jgi:sensor c-di-GMP phosphodiesterase-like protein